jgi:hypothetical protein
MESTSALEFLLISNNHHTLTTVAGGLEKIGVRFNFAANSEAGRDYVGRHRFDGIIVDLDVPGAQDLILSIRQGPSNPDATIFACMPRSNLSPVAIVPGANVLLPQPLTAESVASLVSASRSTILGERRRFFRHRVELPVRLTVEDVERRAMMRTLSEGGMSVYMHEPVERAKVVAFVFELPAGGLIAGKGAVVWVNNEGMAGIKFVFLRDPGDIVLQNWCRQRQASAD